MAVEQLQVCEFLEFGHNFWFSGKLKGSSLLTTKNHRKIRSELGDVVPQSRGHGRTVISRCQKTLKIVFGP